MTNPPIGVSSTERDWPPTAKRSPCNVFYCRLATLHTLSNAKPPIRDDSRACWSANDFGKVMPRVGWCGLSVGTAIFMEKRYICIPRPLAGLAFITLQMITVDPPPAMPQGHLALKGIESFIVITHGCLAQPGIVERLAFILQAKRRACNWQI